MKKSIVYVLLCLMILSYKIDVHPAHSEIGKQLEYYQWGVLEDVLYDLKNNIITTDECIIIGCNILSLNDSHYTDNDEKFKLIPPKYKFNKKSVKKGPYFFIEFIYDNEKVLSQNAINTFKNSNWCDYEYYDSIFKANIKQYFEKYKNIIDFNDIIFKLVKDKILTPEIGLVLINGRFIKLYPNYFNSDRFHFNAINKKSISAILLDQVDKNNLKLSNILNFYNYIAIEKYIENDPTYLDQIKVSLTTPPCGMTIKQIVDELQKQIGNHINLDRSVRISTEEIKINLNNSKFIDALKKIIKAHNKNKIKPINPFDSGERYRCKYLCIRKEGDIYIFCY